MPLSPARDWPERWLRSDTQSPSNVIRPGEPTHDRTPRNLRRPGNHTQCPPFRRKLSDSDSICHAQRNSGRARNPIKWPRIPDLRRLQYRRRASDRPTPHGLQGAMAATFLLSLTAAELGARRIRADGRLFASMTPPTDRAITHPWRPSVGSRIEPSTAACSRSAPAGRVRPCARGGSRAGRVQHRDTNRSRRARVLDSKSVAGMATGNRDECGGSHQMVSAPAPDRGIRVGPQSPTLSPTGPGSDAHSE